MSDNYRLELEYGLQHKQYDSEIVHANLEIARINSETQIEVEREKN